MNLKGGKNATGIVTHEKLSIKSFQNSMNFSPTKIQKEELPKKKKS